MSSRTIMVVGGLNRPAPYFAEAHGRGLSLYDFDEATGAATPLCETLGVDNPSYLSIAADGRTLYANSEVFGWAEGTVEAYAIEAATPRLRPLNKQSSLGSTAAHSSFDATGRFLLVANYATGAMDEGSNQAIAVYRIGAGGWLAPAHSSAAHEGHGPNPDRQDRPHPHCVVTAPDNRFAVVADLGLDAVFSYPFSPDGLLDGASRVRSALPPGSGPRHSAFHRDGGYALLICELNSTIVSLRYDAATGRFTIADTASALPAGAPASHCSGIQLHPNGRFVYGANRGHDSVAVFGFDPADGTLSPLGHTPCGGKTPRDMTIDPSGRFLLVCNQDSDRIAVFAIDGATGALTPTGHDIEIGTPMCVKFARI
jgi:6-phosphogluconolactonase